VARSGPYPGRDTLPGRNSLDTRCSEINVRRSIAHRSPSTEFEATQLRTAKRLNLITAIGAAVGVLGLGGVVASLIITKQAADDGAAAARAATRQAELMEITAKRQLRAYLFVSATSIDDVAVGKRPNVKGRFDNYGQTPVYNATWLAGINIAEYPLKTKIDYSECIELFNQENANRWFFGKDVQINKLKAQAITDSDLANLMTKNFAIYFHGRVCYRDVFQEIHWTDFCTYWLAENGVVTGLASYCSTDNYAE
jgi:hypothetical protein